MPDSTATGAAAAPTTTTDSTDGFLTKDALTSGAHFKKEEGELLLPELGGKVFVRAVSFREQRQILSHIQESSLTSLKSTAFQMSRYVVKPSLTEDEWHKILSNPDLPAKAVNRINQRIGKLMQITDEEEQAVADEFLGAEN